MRQGAIAAVASATLALGLLAAGCGGSDDPSESGTGSPEDTVASYIAAGQDGDGDRVCDLLTSESVDLLEQFSDGDCADSATDGISDLPDDFKIGDANEDGDTATVTVTGDGDSFDIPLAKDGDDWKIDLTAIDLTGGASSSSGDTTDLTTP